MPVGKFQLQTDFSQQFQMQLIFCFTISSFAIFLIASNVFLRVKKFDPSSRIKPGSSQFQAELFNFKSLLVFSLIFRLFSKSIEIIICTFEKEDGIRQCSIWVFVLHLILNHASGWVGRKTHLVTTNYGLCLGNVLQKSVQNKVDRKPKS